MSGSTKVTKLNEVRYWFEENKDKVKKFLVMGLLSFVALSLVALIRGTGYEATANVTSVKILVRGHPCMGYFVTGNLTCTFNPFLYPATYIFGYETNSKFVGVSEPYDSKGKSVKKNAEISALLREFSKNIPYYLTISLAVAFGSSKLIERFQAHFRKITPK